MKGEPINLNSIKENFNTESLNDVSRNVGDALVKKIVSVLGKVIKEFLKIIAVIMLSILSLILFIIFIALFLSLFIGFDFYTINLSLNELGELFFVEKWHAIAVIIITLFLVIAPIVWVVSLIVKIISKETKIPKFVNLSTLGIWIVSLLSGLILLGITLRDLSKTNHSEETIVLNQLGKEIQIRVLNKNHFLDYEDANTIALGEDSNIEIEPTIDSIAYMIIEKYATSSTHKLALEKAENINFNYKASEKKLVIDSKLLFPLSDKLRFQNVDIKLYLPIGTIFTIDNDSYYSLNWHTQKQITKHKKMQVTASGLKCINCLNKSSISNNTTLKSNYKTIYLNDKKLIDIKIDTSDKIIEIDEIINKIQNDLNSLKNKPVIQKLKKLDEINIDIDDNRIQINTKVNT